MGFSGVLGENDEAVLGESIPTKRRFLL